MNNLAKRIVIPMTGHAMGRLWQRKASTNQRVLPPLGGRKTPVELATLTANVLGAVISGISDWQAIFLSITQHTCVLENIDLVQSVRKVFVERVFSDADVHENTVEGNIY